MRTRAADPERSGWKNECRLREIRLACDLLHRGIVEAGRVVKDRERVALERRLREDVDDPVIYIHRGLENRYAGGGCIVLYRSTSFIISGV